MRFKCFLIGCMSILCLAGVANASILSSGDDIKFQRGPGGSGGEFGVRWPTGSATDADDTLFITFCLEKDESVDFVNTYEVHNVNTTEAIAGGNNTGDPGPNGGDLLDIKTQWLYYNFREGLDGDADLGELNGLYVFGDIEDKNVTNRIQAAKDLQDAIWFIEEEIGNMNQGEGWSDGNGKTGDDYLTLAEQAEDDWNDFLTNGGEYNGNMGAAINFVKVLNIKRNGQNKQSQLYLEDDGDGSTTIPEPASILIWSVLGCCGVAGACRRKKDKKEVTE